MKKKMMTLLFCFGMLSLFAFGNEGMSDIQGRPEVGPPHEKG
ncbi:hypothetical protein QWT69_03510 [Sporosarcina oncorhynchi]|uniref:Uncharacterized protein n=1 Tax=Sporosarcina oncorhynchi TaxID=3056444 RepID=A0ABZ0L7V4_9BACL|nr:hypothetical protein [Sporosarcina sp. T2O-4]WOV88205.1 hypothetical protein QWT69_03510 [Sporosarcina sp. T2O-4]